MTRVPIIYGCADFGAKGTNTAKIHDLKDCQALVDTFVQSGYHEFDTSRFYANGTSEEYIGKLDLKGSLLDTKILPLSPGDFAPQKLRDTFWVSLQALGLHKINIFYLHAPDRSVPIIDTLQEVNELHKQGFFKYFGLSNFHSWEVAEIWYICEMKGWIKPTVYQGCYNAIYRVAETELVPCLRRFGIKFYAYSPLAGGLLAGPAITESDLRNKQGSRWDPKKWHGAKAMLESDAQRLPALNALKAGLAERNVSPVEAAQRWLQHHSVLTPTDAVLLGARTLDQLNANISASEGGPLPKEIVELLDKASAEGSRSAEHYAKK